MATATTTTTTSSSLPLPLSTLPSHTMAPHKDASPLPAEIKLEDFKISRYGFLPENEPLSRLSNPYYAPWEHIVERVADLLKTDQLRREVDGLPVLDTAHLLAEEEWRRAYVLLAFMTHGYIWGGEKPSDYLPPQIAIPFTAVAKHLGLPPTATYAALNLWNYALASSPSSSTLPSPSDFSSVRMLHTFTGTASESWFYLISVIVEARGARILPTMLSAISAAARKDHQEVIRRLNELTLCIDECGAVLERMYEGCDTEVFYHQIRPFLAGSKGMEGLGLGKGVWYDYDAEGSRNGEGERRDGENGEWIALRGGSNAQSSLIQFFDAVLGVVHKSQGNARPDGPDSTTPTSAPKSGGKDGATESFHQEMRSYMPAPHRAFLEYVTATTNIRQFALAPISTPDQLQLRDAYQTAIKALSIFRDKHLQIVTRYIIIPARKASERQGRHLAMVSKEEKGEGLKGTGGTALIPFLKQTRDETDEAGRGNVREA